MNIFENFTKTYINYVFQTTRGSLPIYILPFTCISQDFFQMKILFQRVISNNQMYTHLLCKFKCWYDNIIYVLWNMIGSFSYRIIEVSADGAMVRQYDDDGAIAR